MDEFGCDYMCRTVGEGLDKYNIPNNWCAEFEAFDGIYPIVCIQVEQVRKSPALMDVKLRIIENPDAEFAGCMVLVDRKTIAFKMNYMSDFTKATSEL